MPDEIKPEDDKSAGTNSTDDKGDQGNPDEYPADLGDAGKRAIDRMKAERDEANRKNAALKAENDQLKAAKDNNDPSRNGGNEKDNKVSDETPAKTPDQIRDEAVAAVTQQNDARVLRSEIRRLAEGKLSDANDALLFLDVSELKPNAHGDFDSAAISTKLDELINSRPYLAKVEQKFQGGADSGSRGDAAPNAQLSREDLKKMTPQDIVKAQREGRLSDILKPT